MTDDLSPYGVAIHEAAHSVIATMFNAPWHAVSARERHGALLPDKDAWTPRIRPRRTMAEGTVRHDLPRRPYR